MDSIPIILFLIVFVMILFGYPVALTLGGISVLAGLIFFDADFFYLVSLRIYGIMNNFVLLAVPLFIFMGLTLEKSGIADKLLETMAILFGKIKGTSDLAKAVIANLCKPLPGKELADTAPNMGNNNPSLFTDM